MDDLEGNARAEETTPSFVGMVVADKYALTGVIGIGGMGTVYEATHTEIGRRLAVKVISSEFAHSTEVERRFRREARAASAVESEHIVQVFDAGRDPIVGLYMVMEFLVGEDLSNRLARTGQMSLEEVVDLACQALRGLVKAHAAGIVHRDLKPANLFLGQREDGTLLVKLLDFGVSKVLNDAKFASLPPTSAALTRAGSAVGTPQYMSPEQAQGLPTVDHRTDVWSLGAVLHEALAGVPPYEEMPTYEQTIIRIVTQPPRPLREAAPGISPPVAAVVDQMLSHDPGQRIALSAALRAFLDIRASLGMRGRQSLDSLADGIPLSDGATVLVNEGSSRGQVPVVARSATSAAVVIETPEGEPQTVGHSAPPRPSDLPGVASSRRMYLATGGLLVVLLVGLAGWFLVRAPDEPTGVVSHATSVVSSSEHATISAVSETAPTHPGIVALEAAEPNASAMASVAPAERIAPTAAPSRHDPPAESHKKKRAAEKPPPTAPTTTQYGGVGVSESY
jgi:serine/threonine-protein kinase